MISQRTLLEKLEAQLKTIASFSLSIRQRLVSYGFSQKQINQHISQLIYSQNEEYMQTNDDTNIQYSSLQICTQQPFQSSIRDILIKMIKKGSSQVQRFITSIASILQLQIASLEEYDKTKNPLQNQHINKQQYETGQQQSSNSISYMAASQKSVEEVEKISNRSSTQAQSLEIQQTRLQCTLKLMMEKTKMLRAMLEKQVLMTTIKHMEDAKQNSSSRYFSLQAQFMA